MSKSSMNIRGKYSLWLPIVLIISVAMVGGVTSQSPEDKPTIYVDPSTYTATQRGELFDINVAVASVTSDLRLIGGEFRLRYNTTLLETKEDWITEGPFLQQFAAYGTWFQPYVEVDYGLVGFLILPSENGNWNGPFPEGSGTLATITFNVTYRPSELEPPVSCDLQLFDIILLNSEGEELSYNINHGHYEILAMPLPKLEVLPIQYTATYLGEVFDIDVDIKNLDPDWRLIGAQFKLRYNTTLLETKEDWITEGPFLQQFAAYGTWFQAYVEYDYGLVGILILPKATGGHLGPFPEGSGTLATITFNVTSIPWEPEPSSVLQLYETILVDISVNSIPHTVSHGYYELSPHLSLVPDTGFEATTILGGRFAANSAVTITWDGTPIPTVPSHLTTDSNGNFTAIISVLTPTDPRLHNVAATDQEGNKAEATFTVVDATGPPGEKGEAGLKGEPAPAEVVWASIVIAIVAIVITAYSLLGKRL